MVMCTWQQAQARGQRRQSETGRAYTGTWTQYVAHFKGLVEVALVAMPELAACEVLWCHLGETDIDVQLVREDEKTSFPTESPPNPDAIFSESCETFSDELSTLAVIHTSKRSNSVCESRVTTVDTPHAFRPASCSKISLDQAHGIMNYSGGMKQDSVDETSRLIDQATCAATAAVEQGHIMQRHSSAPTSAPSENGVPHNPSFSHSVSTPVDEHWTRRELPPE
jgi:hypothetical protein